MQERANDLKAALSAGAPSIGLWCSLVSSLATEVMAGTGAGWLLLDCEHGPNDLASILAQLNAVGRYPVEPVVRLPSDDPIAIKRFLDIGARSLMIPNIETASQAQQIVRATRYAPAGVRGFSVAHRANRFGRIGGYHAGAAGAQLLAIQIESRAGVDAAADIAAAEGVDVLFVGPGDLSANLGAMGNPGAAEVQEAIADVLDAAARAGKSAGILAPRQVDADRYIKAGFRMVAVGSDLGILAAGADALVAGFGPFGS